MAKNIMHTSDKSNFILNMTEEQYSKGAAFGLIAACLAVSLLTLYPELSTSAVYSIPAIGLAIPGVICIILALISVIRKFISKKAVFAACAFGAMVGWGTVSLVDSYDMNVGFYGYPQRGEGLMAILFYCCFFITAASIKREKALKAVVNGIITAGLVNSLFAMIQIFTGKFTHYPPIYTKLDFAASGLSQSPIFLAMILTLALIAALVTFVLDSSKKRRIFCLASACTFTFAMIYTYSFMSLVGIVLAVIAAIASAVIKKSPKKSLVFLTAPIAAGAVAVALCFAGIASKSSSYKLLDGKTLWTFDAYNRVSSSGQYDKRAVDINNTYDVYDYLNRKTIDIIKENPITGTGPEQLVYPQIYTVTDRLGNRLESMTEVTKENPGTFDKVYNEYLYTAATRGIPSLIALLCVIISVLSVGYKNMKKSSSPESACLFFVTLGGSLIFLIGCSNIAFAPIFWTAAGASCAMSISDNAQNNEDPDKKTAPKGKNKNVVSKNK